MECGDGTEVSSRVYGGRVDGVLGSLAAWGLFEWVWGGVGAAIIVDLLPGGPARRHPSCSKASLAAGIGAFGTGGDFQKYYRASISPIDSQDTGPLAFDGEPGNQPEWWL